MNYQHVETLFKMYMELPTEDRYQKYLIFVSTNRMYEALISQGYRAVLVDPLSGVMLRDIKSWIQDHQVDMMNYKSISCLSKNDNQELQSYLDQLNLPYMPNGWKILHDKDFLADTGNETLLNDHLHKWIDQYDPEIKEPDTNSHRLTASGLLRSIENQTEPIKIPGFPELTRKLQIRPEISIIVSARPGGGKSALALNLANALNKDHTVLYFDIEMSERILNNRLLAIESGLPYDEISRFGNIELRNTIEDTAERIANRKPFIVYHDVSVYSEIARIIKTLDRDRNEPMIVIVDHIHLVTNGIKEMRERFTQLAVDFHKLAKEENLVLFLLAQQNRQGQDTNEPPTMSSLKETGELENSADKVLFIWEKKEQGSLPELKLWIAKNREATPLQAIPIEFDKRTQIIRETVTEPLPDCFR